MFKKYSVFIMHLLLSISIPLFITVIVFINQSYLNIHRDVTFLEALLFFTCSITMLFSSGFLYLPKFSSQLLIFLILSILLRFLFIVFFVFLQNKNKKAGIVSDIFFNIVTIVFGLFCLLVIGKH